MQEESISIDQWDKIAVELSTRAEELNKPSEAFVDTIFLNVLKAKQNQIIYGRRGMGKTHLLKRLQEEYSNNFVKYRTIPIFINGSQLKHQTTTSVQIPSVTAFSLYVEFINSLVGQLQFFINNQLEPSIWDKILGRENAYLVEKAKTLSNELNNLLSLGEVRFLPSGEAANELQTINETTSKISGGVKINLSDPKSVGWKVNAGVGVDKKSSRSGIMLKKIKGEIILPFSEVSRGIQELLDLLDNATIVALFDEWSAVDNVLDTQPYLADMIKKTMSSITQMHVKLSCIPTRTLLASPRTIENLIPIGYEEGDDISADVDLDSIVFSENDLRQFLPFFLLVLKRHIGLSINWIKKMEPADFERFIFVNVFENPDTFSELCQASAGVPRDFLNLFRNATAIKVAESAKNIKLSHIRMASDKLYNSKKTILRPDSHELIILDRIYKEIVAKNETYFFLLKEKHVRNKYIELLWSEKLIHKIPATYYDIDTHEKYYYYQIDYGKCVDLLKSQAFENGKAKLSTPKWSCVITGLSIVSWLIPVAGVAGNLIQEATPMIAGFLEQKRAISEKPAGKLDPILKEIIVDDSFFG